MARSIYVQFAGKALLHTAILFIAPSIAVRKRIGKGIIHEDWSSTRLESAPYAVKSSYQELKSNILAAVNVPRFSYGRNTIVSKMSHLNINR